MICRSPPLMEKDSELCIKIKTSDATHVEVSSQGKVMGEYPAR